MAIKIDLTRLVDEFLAADKTLMGADRAMDWQPGSNANELAVKLPIEVGGEFRGANLVIKGYPRESVLKYRLAIVMPPAVSRIDYVIGGGHTNTLATDADGIPGIVRGPHYHPWEINRRFFQGPRSPMKLHNAVELDGPRTFDAGLRWFCGETRIRLPPRHEIELPTRSFLI